MHAMTLERPGRPLEWRELQEPHPGATDVVLKVKACGVCRTDLHVVDGELHDPKPNVIPGHEIVGVVIKRGSAATRFHVGERVGVPWLGMTCGNCMYCNSGRENLCAKAIFTGYTRDGGYAEMALADERYCLHIPASYSDTEAAPLLCAGLIGYRSLKMTADANRIGIYGFGAAAHIVAQVACFQQRRVYAFTRPGDTLAQQFAIKLGCEWSGDSTTPPPDQLDAALIFAPVGGLVPTALSAVVPGGMVVCGGIHMSNIPSFPYRLLWGERCVKSVANLTRADGEEFLAIAPKAGVHPHTVSYPLQNANEALDALRKGAIEGAAVLVP
jgi:alcohol dehydrogenase, propanol-preferring